MCVYIYNISKESVFVYIPIMDYRVHISIYVCVYINIYMHISIIISGTNLNFKLVFYVDN